MTGTDFVIRRLTMALIASALLLSTMAIAQDTKSEVTIQGMGTFTKNSTGNGIENQVTQSGGALVGYRYNFNHWLAAEADYAWTRNSQQYFGGTVGRIQTNLHEVTGAAVVKLPEFRRLQPFVMAGGGAIVFDPTNDVTNISGATRQTRGAFLYGGGADYPLSKRFAIRAQYRGLVYKTPTFNLAGLNNDKWTHQAQASAGIVLRF